MDLFVAKQEMSRVMESMLLNIRSATGGKERLQKPICVIENAKRQYAIDLFDPGHYPLDTGSQGRP